MGGPWRLIYLGAPEFAVPTLAALAASEDQVVLVVTQPDRPKGRGRKTSPPPVKILAERLGLPVFQPESLRDPSVIDHLKSWKSDLLVVVAYGKILPKPILDLTPPGPLNLHPSLLPKYRGPSPIQSAILAGDAVTGVTTMILDEGQDTGPILSRREIAILENETAGQLHDRLAVVGADLVVETIAGLKAGDLRPRPQADDEAVECRLLEKDDGLIDWSQPAVDLACRVRGLDPWPGAFTFFEGRRLKLFAGRAAPGVGLPGTVLALEDGELLVGTGQGVLRIAEFQLEGKNRQTAGQFWNGQRLAPGTRLG